jgi:hypothetical protein
MLIGILSEGGLPVRPLKKKSFTKLWCRINMKAFPIVEKGGVLLRLVLSVVAFGLVCCCVVRCIVACGLVKEVMGWRYFADVASMSFSEKNPYRRLWGEKVILRAAIWFCFLTDKVIMCCERWPCRRNRESWQQEQHNGHHSFVGKETCKSLMVIWVSLLHSSCVLTPHILIEPVITGRSHAS